VILREGLHVGALKQLARFAQQCFARRSQADGLCLTFEQALANLIFKRFDLPAQCGLRQKHLLRRSARCRNNATKSVASALPRATAGTAN
jgi:hypothetical protein